MSALFNRKARAGMAATLALLLLIGVFAYRNTNALIGNAASVTQSYRVLASLENLLSLLKDAETGQRGYLLVGDPAYLEPYRAATNQIDLEFAALELLVGDNPAQRERLPALRGLIDQRLERLRATIAIRDSQGLDAAIGRVRENQGKELMDQIRSLVGEMQDRERLLLASREDSARNASREALAIMGGRAVAALLLVALVVSVVSADLGRRKQDQARLEGLYRESEQARGEVRSILDAVGEMVALMAPDGRFVSINRRFTAMLGLSADEVLGKTFADLAPALRRIFAEMELFRDMPGPGDDQRQFNQIATQSYPTQRELNIYTTPVRTADGEYLGRLYVLRDVTHEREVDRMKSEFISMVSHELRTPLTSIRGYTELLIDGEVGELAEEQLAFLGIVRHNADRLISLIGDFLDISRIESGKTELKLAPLDLAELIPAAAAVLRPQIERKRQRLSLRLAPELPTALADRDRVMQVLTNLISNAHKYTPEGGLIEVSAVDDGPSLRVEVRDSGIGLSADDQARIFNKFFRVQNRVTQEAGGTGLGLSITKSLVEMHGGTIAVASSPGEGASFSFTLPLSAARAVAVPAPAGGGAAANGTILVVDDERDIANLLRRYLERAGYRVVLAHRADEALAVAKAELPDLITLDVVLPDTDGFTVLEWLKADEATRRIPVILISVMPDTRSGNLLGAVDYLVKPVRDDVLLSHVSEILAADRQGSVLVADDDPHIRALLAGYLRKAGYHVIEARDGEEAVLLSRSFQPGMVLMDIKMPVLDGIEALRQLRSDTATRALPVVMMTASPGVYDAHRSTVELLGAGRLLNKPCTPQELAAAIAEGLGQPPAAAAPPPPQPPEPTQAAD
ncbi:MAG TPA: response regulator [Herpetosiphonaceae bacterium]